MDTDLGQVQLARKPCRARVALASLLEKDRSPYARGPFWDPIDTDLGQVHFARKTCRACVALAHLLEEGRNPYVLWPFGALSIPIWAKCNSLAKLVGRVPR